MESISRDWEKSCPRQGIESAGIDALSPRTAAAETEGMLGSCVTAALAAKGWDTSGFDGVAAESLPLMAFVVSPSSRLVPIDATGVEGMMLEPMCVWLGRRSVLETDPNFKFPVKIN